MNAIRTKFVQLGEFHGICIPEEIREKLNLDCEVELTIEKGRLVVQAISKRREGWEEKFALMAQNGDDALIDDVQESLWDASGEWEW